MWKDYDIYNGKVFSILWLSEIYLLITGPDGEIVSMKYNVKKKQEIPKKTFKSSKHHNV
jgi:hypothetical protein